MRRLLAVAAVCMASVFAAHAVAAPLPNWMLGDWSVQKIYQDADKPYEPKGGPSVWWEDKVFHIGRDRLAFADWVCQGPHATLRRGTVSSFLKHKSGETLDGLGMPAESAPVAYYHVTCDSLLMWSPAFQGYPGHFLTDKVGWPWTIVVRSRAEVAMPFMAATFVEFVRRGPTV